MNFPSINIQGNILNSEIIDKIVNEELKHQDPISFGLQKNDRLREEIGLAWSAIRGLWQTFSMRRNRIGDDESGTSETRNFWMLPFLTTLGYDVEKANAEMMDNKSYAISHRAANLQGFPVHIMGINDSLDKRREASGPRLSPHALVQEYLNKSEDYLYALVTNGKHLRLLRDSSRLVRLTYIEFDLEKMMDEEIYADFAILYRLLHATRMPKEKGEGENAIIEFYHQEALSSGTRIREKLSEAVEYAIKELANGFLKHPANEALRENVQAGILTPADFYLQSLRLVYRMLFLLVIEDRSLVYPDKLDENGRRKREIYWKFYSMDRLRRLAAQQQFVEANKYDLWQNLKVAFRLFEDAGYAQKLGLQPLASGIFHPDALGQLEQTLLTNQHLLEVVQKLCYFSDKTRAAMVRVNYGDLDVEEFGSVYEGLLEYQPVFAEVDNQWVFTFEKGSERSSSGSHYTPEELVRPLIKHSLDYLIEDCLNKPEERIKTAGLPQNARQEQALLSLRVCDVACGSGHILLSAARRIATELAKVRTAEEQPSPPALRHAMRDTIRHTIYGVDKNPLAVELCKVALWLEAHNPGEPLNFLDHHIKCGDSIVGLAHRSELEKGIADEAFKSLPDDEKEVAAAFRKQNKEERKEREAKATQLKTEYEDTTVANVQEAMAEYQSFAKMPETTPEQIAGKQKAYQKYLDGRGHQWLKQMADMQVAQFFISKSTTNKPYLLTDAAYRQMLAGYKGWQGQHAAKANVLAQEKRFFHWFIEFPEVFAQGGFDCVLGNPPFRGGLYITNDNSPNYTNYLKTNTSKAGSTTDLVAYFFRRIFNLISKKGFLSLIGTNSISEGDTRETSLEFIVENDGRIIFANKSVKWPGEATLHVSLITITKDKIRNRFTLNNQIVQFINSWLSSSGNQIKPYNLMQIEHAFLGTTVYGKGFFINQNEREYLLSKNIEHQKFIKQFLNGDDVLNDPESKHSRYVLYFQGLDIDYISVNYPIIFEFAYSRIFNERQKSSSKGRREKWWLYTSPAEEIYRSISGLQFVIATCFTSKHPVFTTLSIDQIFSNALVIVCSDSYSRFGVLHSSFHSAWVQEYGSTLETRQRYAVSDVYNTFPFPKIIESIDEISKEYLITRTATQKELRIGLTDLYNAIHDRHNQNTDINELRNLYIQVDNSTLVSYGWTDIQLRHDFYEVASLPENDRIRFTIHPDARKEVLKRLLQLNHQIFEQEAREGLHKEETVRKFYEQKGEPVPEEVSKWFKKGKEYKKPKSRKPKVKEDEQGYGDLFNQ